MANVPQKTLNWLYDVLKREYRDPNRTYSDLAHTLSRYPGFAPRTDVYTFDDGSPALLVHLNGTIPVNFRGKTYRFPITLWIPHTYPYDAPIAYFAPTDDMLVRPGQHVGGDGRIYHHYLANWREAWERSNVVDFMSLLADIFAREPPLISKQHTAQQPEQSQIPPQPAPPLPSDPRMSSFSPSQPLQQRSFASSGAPRPPPKEQEGDYAAPPSPVQQRPGRYDAPPPLPTQVRVPGRPTSVYEQQTYSNGLSQRPPSGLQHQPQRSSSLNQPMNLQQTQTQSQQRQGYLPQQVYNSAGIPLVDPRKQQYQQNQQQQTPSSAPQNAPYLQQQQHQYPQSNPRQYSNQAQAYPQTQQSQQQPRAQNLPPPPQQQPPHHQQHYQTQPKKPPPAPSLLDSPFDIPFPPSSSASKPNPGAPAPPIPVNPQKDALLSHLSHQITQTLHTQIDQTTTALPALQSQHSALTQTLSTIYIEQNNINSLSTTLQSNITLLQTSLTNSDKVISSARHRSSRGDIPKVDEMLVPPTVVSKQLYDTVCEEKGIEAGIWALHEGFVGGRIGAEVWARRTRELAREGFRKRYLTRKVAMGMGLE